MRKKVRYPFILFIFLSALIGCHPSYQSQSLAYKNYRIDVDTAFKDSSLAQLIKPYSDSVNSSMNDIIGYAEKTLEKKRPESDLGNFMVDAYYYMAQEKYNTAVDAAFLNYGGIRLTQLPAGNVTRGKIFELMPFDNLLILQKLKGDVLQQLLDLIAAHGGWPVTGISMQIKNNKAVHVQIGGKPLDLNTIYTTVNSDFVANGGDNAAMLKEIPQISNGYLMRDALFDYIKKLKNQGKNITAVIENRIINAE